MEREMENLKIPLSGGVVTAKRMRSLTGVDFCPKSFRYHSGRERSPSGQDSWLDDGLTGALGEATALPTNGTPRFLMFPVPCSSSLVPHHPLLVTHHLLGAFGEARHRRSTEAAALPTNGNPRFPPVPKSLRPLSLVPRTPFLLFLRHLSHPKKLSKNHLHPNAL